MNENELRYRAPGQHHTPNERHRDKQVGFYCAGIQVH